MPSVGSPCPNYDQGRRDGGCNGRLEQGHFCLRCSRCDYIEPNGNTLPNFDPYNGPSMLEWEVEVLGETMETRPHIYLISGTRPITKELAMIAAIVLDGGSTTQEMQGQYTTAQAYCSAKPKNPWWDRIGTLVGLAVALLIFIQWRAEVSNPEPSTLSYVYLFGFLGMQCFWTAYGWQFNRPAIWVTNFVCVLVQLLLILSVTCFGC